MEGSTGVEVAKETDNVTEESLWTKLSFWLCALHLFTLCSLAFAKPIFDITGKDAAFFVVRGSRPVDVVSLIAILCILLPGTLILLEALLKLLARRAQLLLHLFFVGALASIYCSQFIKPWKGLNGYVAAALIITAGAGFAVLYARTQSFRRLITLASPFIVIIPAFFVFGSQVGRIILPGGFSWTDSRDKSTHIYLKKKPPIVFVVMDELPIVSLLDAKGEIDSKRFPNLAAFAATSNWYRNTTSVSPTTETAVPAILTGIFPKDKLLPNITDHPDNIFTLLASNYKFNVYESACYLCPERLSSQNRPQPPYLTRLRLLLEDITVVYLHRLLPEMFTSYLPTITNRWGNFLKKEEKPAQTVRANDSDILSRKEIADKLLAMKKGDRPQIFRSFIADIDTTRKDTFNFIHILLPHGPFEYLPSTGKYQAVSELGLEGATKTNDKFTGPQGLVDQYHHLHLLQLAAMDKLVGELIAKLKTGGLFDESLIVFVADHGTSFKANDFNRELSNSNAADIMFVPLFIKLPSQQKGKVENLDAETIDVVPTIADYLGVQVPWKASGVSLFSKNHIAKTSKMMAATDGVHTLPLERLLQMRQQTLENNIKTFGLAQQGSTLFWFGDQLDLLGKKVSELEVKQDKVSINFEQQHLFDSVDLKQKLYPALIKGELGYRNANNAKIAISVNGIIQGVTTAYNIHGKNVFTAVIPETAFKDGVNKVDGFIVLTNGKENKYLISAKQEEESFNLQSADIKSSDGTTYPIVAGSLPGVVDELQMVAKDVAITGWAANLNKTKAADAVVVFVNGKFTLAGRTTETRPDVSKAYKKLQTPGFRFLLPPGTNTKYLRVFALSDKVAYELNYQPRLALKADYLKKAYTGKENYEVKDNTIYSGGTKYTPVPEVLKGSVDILKREGNNWLIAGWAADVKKFRAIDAIIIFFKDRSVALGQTRVLRPDLSQSLKISPSEYLGFEYLLPVSKIKNSDDVRVFAVSEGSAMELTVQKKSQLNGQRYSIQDDVLLSASGEEINIYPNSLQGGMDLIRVGSKKLTVAGWAANLKAGVPVDAVVIFSGDDFVGSGTPSVIRADVGKAFDNYKLARSGFNFALPAKIKDPGKIRVFAVSKAVAIELQNPKRSLHVVHADTSGGTAFTLEAENVTSAAGASFAIGSNGLQTSWDTVTRNGEIITISGWAADVQQSKLPERIVVFSAGKFIGTARPRVARPDVSKAFGKDDIEYCGFTLSFPAKNIGDLEKIRVFALHEGVASEFSNSVAMAAHRTKPAPLAGKPVFTTATTGSRPQPQVLDEQ